MVTKQVANRPVCTVDGTGMDRKKLFSQWFFLMDIPDTQMSRKELKQSPLNRVCISHSFVASVKISAMPMQPIVATNTSWNFKKIFANKGLWCRRLSRQLVIYAFSCQNSIVNSISLSSFGVWWKNIFVTIATILSTRWRKTCQKHWPWFLFKPFAGGNIGCTVGWRLTGQDWVPKMLRFKSINSVPQHINHIDAFQMLLWVLLTSIQ